MYIGERDRKKKKINEYKQQAGAISNYSNKSNLKAPAKCFTDQRSMSEESLKASNHHRVSVSNETTVSTTFLLAFKFSSVFPTFDFGFLR